MLDVVEGHALKTGQMEQGIEQHRTVAGGEDEAVPVRPVRIGGIELQEFESTAQWQHRPYP